MEKRPSRSSVREFSSTGLVENLGIIDGDLWMAKTFPQGFHSEALVLHRLSPS